MTTDIQPAPPAPQPLTPDELRGLFSRRTVLTGMAATAFAAGVGGAVVGYRDDVSAATVQVRTAGAATGEPEHAWCMVIDLRFCDGCKHCTRACQKRHDLRPEQTWIRVFELDDEHGGTFHMPRPCMMCEDPPCLKVCPVGATLRTDEGLVLVDTDTCVGSRACMAACPYEARYFNWTEPLRPSDPDMPSTPQMPMARRGTVGKCVLCADLLPQGELPACVKNCPMGVLYVGDLVTDVAVNSQGTSVVLSRFLAENDAVRFKEELGTHPRVWYILGHGQKLEGAR